MSIPILLFPFITLRIPVGWLTKYLEASTVPSVIVNPKAAPRIGSTLSETSTSLGVPEGKGGQARVSDWFQQDFPSLATEYGSGCGCVYLSSRDEERIASFVVCQMSHKERHRHTN